MSEHKYEVGQIVNWVNDYGTNLGEREVVGLCNPYSDGGEPRYYIAPIDTPWFALSESELTLSENQRRIAPIGFAETVMQINNGRVLEEVYRRHGMLKQFV
jgi:hypothetical protein